MRGARMGLSCSATARLLEINVAGDKPLERSYGINTTRAQQYVASISEALESRSSRAVADRVRELVISHDRWRLHEAISLNAAENVMSARARELLMSDMATRVTEGFPGDKDFPADRQNRFVDEIEATIIHLLRRMFDAKHVEWRPVSTSMANATLFFALTQPGDTILVQSESAGGNYSYNPLGPPRAARLNVQPLPFNEDTFEVRTEEAIEAILRQEPKIVVVGGSNVLFPYPVAQLSAAAERVGAKLVYDAAHLALYIGSGMFQDPLREGAHVLAFSSHKLMSGAVGGIILSNDDEVAERVLPYSFPTFIQTRDQNKYAATAHALAEMSEFGPAYAQQTVANARALGAALEEEGFEVLCSDRGYTETHQIFVFIPEEDSFAFECLCQKANLLLTRAQRMGSRSAARLTSQEITRRGMTAEHMPIIARWLRRIIREREAPSVIAAEVKEFLQDFRILQFSFDEEEQPLPWQSTAGF